MFSFRALFFVLVISAAVHAAPVSTDVTDTDVLRIALVLEHIENAFYHSGITAYSEQDFLNAGFPAEIRGRFAQIGQHEAAHVELLTKLLGHDAVQPCQYTFPHTEPRTFVALSSVLETLGTSAYIGAAKHISDKSYLTTAGSILAVEARHTSWVSSTVGGGSPWEGAFDIPLVGTGPVSLAAQFILPESCPLANGGLPFIPLPNLSLSNNSPAPGEPITVNLLELLTESLQAAYLAWFDGPEVVYSPIGLLTGRTTVPDGLRGPVLVAVVSSKDQRPNNANLLSRVAVIQISN